MAYQHNSGKRPVFHYVEHDEHLGEMHVLSCQRPASLAPAWPDAEPATVAEDAPAGEATLSPASPPTGPPAILLALILAALAALAAFFLATAATPLAVGSAPPVTPGAIVFAVSAAASTLSGARS